MTLNLGYAATILIFMGIFFVLFLIKISQQSYHPFTYWLTFTATAIAGTAISDYLDRTLGLGYAMGSLLLVSLLGVILVLWYLKEHSLAVDNIRSTTAETYYWSAFLIANTLGTAAGDFLADDIGWGFLASAVLIGSVLIATALMHFFTSASKIILFWLAFVLTRPLGATFGDLLTKSADQGGLDFGTIGASLFFTIALIIGLYFEVKREKNIAVSA